jgi:hypothetical protein
MTDLFKEIIPSILQTKVDCLVDEKDYVPFVVNKALSFHYDCVFYVNQMNMLPHTDRGLQYQFYLNNIRPYKRPFQKWLKRETISDLEAVKEYYGYSNEKAREILSLIPEDHLEMIKQYLDKGGINNGKPKRSHRGETK